MEHQDEIELIEVFSGKIWEVDMVNSLLVNAEIRTFLKDEINGTLFPWVVSPGGVGAVKILVLNFEFEKAMKIVNKFIKSTSSSSIK